jgi:hypothetical protein
MTAGSTPENWLFEGICSPLSRLGLVLRLSLDKVEGSIIDENEIRRRVIEGVNQKVGCNIEVDEFLQKGSKYFNVEPGRRQAKMIDDFVANYEKRLG